MAGVLAVTSAFAARAPSTLQQANTYTDSKVAEEANARQLADSNESTARGDADTQEASIRSQSDASLQEQIDLLAAVTATGGLGAYEYGERIGSVMYGNGQMPGAIGSGADAAIVGIITSKGYLVEIALERSTMVNTLPVGESIFFDGPGCTGSAYIGSNSRLLTWKGAQGFVYSHRSSERLFYVPRNSVQQLRNFASALNSGTSCTTTPISAHYSLRTLPNDPEVTGVHGAASRGPVVFGMP
jgi:hypothetical protein